VHQSCSNRVRRRDDRLDESSTTSAGDKPSAHLLHSGGRYHPGGSAPVSTPADSLWKGIALALDVRAAGEVAQDAAWTYPKPSAGYEMLAEHVAFYCALMDECWVGDELAAPQPGHFYGGWVTSSVVGPFKGMPGSHGW
jgi:hypothetical protein